MFCGKEEPDCTLVGYHIIQEILGYHGWINTRGVGTYCTFGKPVYLSRGRNDDEPKTHTNLQGHSFIFIFV